MSETPKVVVTDRAGSEAGVAVVPMSPWLAILVRAGRTFLQTWIGLILASLGTGVITAPDFLQLLLKTGSIALAPAFISLLQNGLELLSKLDQTRPDLRG